MVSYRAHAPLRDWHSPGLMFRLRRPCLLPPFIANWNRSLIAVSRQQRPWDCHATKVPFRWCKVQWESAESEKWFGLLLHFLFFKNIEEADSLSGWPSSGEIMRKEKKRNSYGRGWRTDMETQCMTGNERPSVSRHHNRARSYLMNNLMRDLTFGKILSESSGVRNKMAPGHLWRSKGAQPNGASVILAKDKEFEECPSCF